MNAVRMQVEPQDVLEIGESVITAEPHVVTKEREHQGVGQRLRDDREIDAGNARPKSKPAELQRRQSPGPEP